MAILKRHVSRLVKAKDCITCVNYDSIKLEGCSLPADQRVKCVKSERSFYAPAIPVT